MKEDRMINVNRPKLALKISLSAQWHLKHMVLAKIAGNDREVHRHGRRYDAEVARAREIEQWRKGLQERIRREEVERKARRERVWFEARFRFVHNLLEEESPLPQQSNTKGFRRLKSELNSDRALGSCANTERDWGTQSYAQNTVGKNRACNRWEKSVPRSDRWADRMQLYRNPRYWSKKPRTFRDL